MVLTCICFCSFAVRVVLPPNFFVMLLMMPPPSLGLGFLWAPPPSNTMALGFGASESPWEYFDSPFTSIFLSFFCARAREGVG